jgi:regulator of sirC expression with transglutaminase-like and TPR domain
LRFGALLLRLEEPLIGARSLAPPEELPSQHGGFMRRLTLFVAIILVSLCTIASAQVRGRGRLQGIVTDKSTSKPLVGAVVTISLPSGNTTPIVSKTDSRGRWSALGLTSGLWNIDIVAPGYQTSRGTANVSETQQFPMIQTGMNPQVVEETQAAAVAQTPLIPKEAADAITEGQDLMKLKEGDPAPAGGAAVTANDVHENAKKAVTDFEKAMPLIPVDKPEGKRIHDQLLQLMAQAYYRAGDLPKAIATLEAVTAADPANTPEAVLLANLYLQNGQLDAGKSLLEKLPASAITDPNAYINVGILFLNKNNPTDAATYFAKAIEMNPKGGDGFYYRGLAYAQLKKNAEARSDFEQVLALAPDSPEAKDAKAMLAALPKK